MHLGASGCIRGDSHSHTHEISHLKKDVNGHPMVDLHARPRDGFHRQLGEDFTGKPNCDLHMYARK